MENDAQMSRRTAVGLFAAIAAAGAIPSQAFAAAIASGQTNHAGRFAAPEPFSWKNLVAQARALARKPYVPTLNSTNAAANFDEAAKLTYGSAETIAGNIRLFPTTRETAPIPVKIALVENGSSRELIDTSGLYVGDKNTDPAGFRVMDATGGSDWVAFQGASYFRACGPRAQYGISARGIAVDTGLASGEEFPSFTHFYIEQTGPDTVQIYALLDGPSLSGAFSFDCHNGTERTIQDVTVSLFMRKDIQQLGLAASSSMFWYDQASPPAQRDWRPEVHDSDGLAIWSGNGERVWRPLVNPPQPELHTFNSASPRGFGLLQRDLNYDHYHDDFIFYERRPSLWVEPKGDWGPGSVYLYEMPTDGETVDNTAMFWRSDTPAKAGDRRDFAYRLVWSLVDPTADNGARCVDILEGKGGMPAQAPMDGVRKYVFDFEGPSIAKLTQSSGLVAQTDLPNDAIVSSITYPSTGIEGRWRVMLDVKISAVKERQFRVFLRQGQSALSETVIKAIPA